MNLVIYFQVYDINFIFVILKFTNEVFSDDITKSCKMYLDIHILDAWERTVDAITVDFYFIMLPRFL